MANADQIAFWNDAPGQTWVEMQDALDRQIGRLGLAAMDILAPQAGERVIDVGCGCGQTTLALAERVGPSGAVLGVDISRPMLGAAQGRASGLPQVRLVEADAQTYRFEPGSFDAVFSRFGVMFFEDSKAAFANLRRALRSGGRLGFVCWRPMSENPWMSTPLTAALRHLPVPPPPDPGAAGPFAFADPDHVRGVLDAAGFTEVAIRGHDAPIGGNDLDETVRLALRLGPLGTLLREHPQAREAVIGDVRAALAAHQKDGRVYLPSAAWIVSATSG